MHLPLILFLLAAVLPVFLGKIRSAPLWLALQALALGWSGAAHQVVLAFDFGGAAMADMQALARGVFGATVAIALRTLSTDDAPPAQLVALLFLENAIAVFELLAAGTVAAADRSRADGRVPRDGRGRRVVDRRADGSARGSQCAMTGTESAATTYGRDRAAAPLGRPGARGRRAAEPRRVADVLRAHAAHRAPVAFRWPPLRDRSNVAALRAGDQRRVPRHQRHVARHHVPRLPVPDAQRAVAGAPDQLRYRPARGGGRGPRRQLAAPRHGADALRPRQQAGPRAAVRLAPRDPRRRPASTSALLAAVQFNISAW